MIPKVIHYCWFGGKPHPKDVVKCIASWRKFFPDYEIKEWNESNFDVNSIPYIRDAYADGKFAFVSDYARIKILNDNGGVYFDTDVEVIKDMRPLLGEKGYFGFESDPGKGFYVNPGIGMASVAQSPVLVDICEVYSELEYRLPDGDRNPYAIVAITTDVLKKHGLGLSEGVQDVDGYKVYPAEYFNPLDYVTGRLRITANTYSIHWFSKTWMNESKLRTFLSRIYHRLKGM